MIKDNLNHNATLQSLRAADDFNKKFETAKDSLMEFSRAVSIVSSSINGLDNVLGKLAQRLQQTHSSFTSNVGEMRNLKDTGFDTIKTLGAALSSAANLSVLVSQSTPPVFLLAGAISALVVIIASVADAVNPSTKSISELNSEIQKFSDNIIQQQSSLTQSQANLRLLEEVTKLSQEQQNIYNLTLRDAVTLYPQIKQGVDEHTGRS